MWPYGSLKIFKRLIGKQKEAAPNSMNLKQQICKTRSFFLLSQFKERRGREKRTVFDHFIDEIFNES